MFNIFKKKNNLSSKNQPGEKDDFSFHDQQNYYLGQDSQKHLEDIKGLDNFDWSEEWSNVEEAFNTLIENIKTGDLKQIMLESEDCRNAIDGISERLKINSNDVIEIIQNQEDSLKAAAQAEVLKAQSDQRKKIKIGRLKLNVSDVVKTVSYGAGAMAGSIFLGVGGIIGVAAVRMIEKMYKGHREEKEINKKTKELRNNIDSEKMLNELSLAAFLKVSDRRSQDFFKLSREQQSGEIYRIIDLKYPDSNKDQQEQLFSLYQGELELEARQLQAEKKFFKKNSGLTAKAKNFLSGQNVSASNRAINSSLAIGAMLGLRLAAREVPLLKNVLGAYVGYNIGTSINKNLYKIRKEQGSEEIKISSQIDFIREKIENLKKDDEEYKEIISKTKLDQLKEEIKKQEAKINEEIEKLKDSSATALLKLEDFNFKKSSPEQYLKLREEVAAAKSYIRFLEVKFNSKKLNDLKEKKLLTEKKDQKYYTIIKSGTSILGAILPEIVNSINDYKSFSHQAEDIEIEISDDVVVSNVSPEVQVEAVNDPEVSLESPEVQAEVQAENYSDQPEINLKLNEIIGSKQKSVILEAGDGISKIFEGHLSSQHQVNFIDEQSGQVISGAANKAVVHPGDQVVFNEEGDIFVVLKHGLSLNEIKTPENIVDGIAQTEIDAAEQPTASSSSNFEKVLQGPAEEFNFNSDDSPPLDVIEGPAEEYQFFDKTPSLLENDISASASDQVPDQVPDIVENIEAQVSKNNISTSASDQIPDQVPGIVENIEAQVPEAGKIPGPFDNLDSQEDLSRLSDFQHSAWKESDLLNSSRENNSLHNIKIEEIFSSSDSLKQSLGDTVKDFKITRFFKVFGPDVYSLTDNSGHTYGLSYSDQGIIKVEEVKDLGQFVKGEGGGSDIVKTISSDNSRFPAAEINQAIIEIKNELNSSSKSQP